MSGFTFKAQMDLARYAALAQAALRSNLIPDDYRTSRCPECGDEMSIGASADHVVMTDNEETELVLIGCEGYVVVPPVLVGMGRTYPNWQDWTIDQSAVLGDEVTGVHAASCDGNHGTHEGCRIA